VEGAHQVLADGQVDAGLAADGGVDHAEQGGGQVDQRHAAEPGGGREPGRVGGAAAADRHHRVGAMGGDPRQPLVQAGHHLQPLGVLAGRDLQAVDGQAQAGQRLPGPLGQVRDRRGEHHRGGLGAGQRRQQLVEPAEQPAADPHRVAAMGGGDVDPGGGRGRVGGAGGQRPAMAPTRRRYHSSTSTAVCSRLSRSVSMATSPAVS
jgi:hypothetical protein